MKDEEARGDNIEEQVALFLSGERREASDSPAAAISNSGEDDSDEAHGWIEASQSALWAYREDHHSEDD